MIKPEQIPIVSMNFFFKSLHEGKSYEECVAAAINAWPGSLREEGVFTMDDDCLILPLPQEKNND